MARLPVAPARRSLDPGSPVNYPGSLGTGEALQGFGQTLQGAGNRISDALARRDEEKAGFDARVRETEFTSELSKLEFDAQANAPADASGLHDSVYGQRTPDGGVAKPGSFDKLFDDYAARMPEAKREEFLAKREVYRGQGSNRLAAAQYKGEQAYYSVEIQKVQGQIENAILTGDPNDRQTFQAFKKQGADIIRQSGLPALEKDVALANWDAKASEALFRSALEKDPTAAPQLKAALGFKAPAPPAAAGKAGGQFGAVAPRLVADLARDFDLTTEQAAGIVGQLGHESGGFGSLQEIAPLVPGSRGGFGYAQWTGPRRKQFEAYAKMQGLDPTSYEANYGFLKYELSATREGAVLGQVRMAKDARSAGRIFTDGFLRPGIPGYESRDKWTDRVVAASGGQPSSAPTVEPDPDFAAIPADRRLLLANQADVAINAFQREQAAAQTAAYASYKDNIELSIVQGGIRDEALISNDQTLSAGDKATLIRAVRSQQVEATATDLAVQEYISGGLAGLNPLDGDQRTTANKVYEALTKDAPPEAVQSVQQQFIQRTNIIPDPVVATMRKGQFSTNPQEFAQSMGEAARIKGYAPLAFDKMAGGEDIRRDLASFQSMVNDRGMGSVEAANRIIQRRTEEGIRNEKILGPAADKAAKDLTAADVTSQFGGFLGFGSPGSGVDPTTKNKLLAEYQEAFREEFIRSGGDPVEAKAQANRLLQKTWGVSEISGEAQLMKYPPEKFYPAIGDSYGYLRDDAIQTATELLGTEPANVWLREALATAADIRADRQPRYRLFYTHEVDGQTVIDEAPGYWGLDASMIEERDRAAQNDIIGQAQARRDVVTEQQNILQAGEAAAEQALTETPGPDWMKARAAEGARERARMDAGAVQAPGPQTTKDKLQERRDQLFENAPDMQPTPWGAM